MENQAHIGRIEIAYTLEGSGPPMVFIHGMAGSRIVWNHVAPPLAADFETLVYDCRGHGESTHPASYTLDDHVADLAGLLHALEIERAHIVGHSMGSFIAQAFAIAHPEHCRSLVLISTRSAAGPERPGRLVSPRGGIPIKEFVGTKTPLMTVVGRMKGYPRPEPEILRAASRALAGFDLRDQLHRIEAPTLILQGDQDRITPLSSARETAAGIPGAKLEVLQGYGHFLHVECPDVLVDRIRSFCLPVP
ncbi:MAG: alpha/beta fold hydrolase [Kyrpidia tusciae]|nr:alpha/beta fold hydrolase [Kyrpidia tusciae]MBE3553334.1 alpha/beta fold hydrolase [Kyrpidia tusciae]